MAISQLLLRVASSNLVGRKLKWYFIIKFSLLLSIVLCRREIRPDAGKTTENELLQVFFEMTTQRNGFGQNSRATDQQTFMFVSCDCNKRSVLKIFMINGLNFQTV